MDAVRALETGANDFIRKPFQPEELLARIRRAIELRHRRNRT
jgi:DNA-binding response OmpR family regulator